MRNNKNVASNCMANGFFLFSGRGREGEVMKNDLSLVFLADWEVYPKFLDR